MWKQVWIPRKGQVMQFSKEKNRSSSRSSYSKAGLNLCFILSLTVL